MNWFVIVKRYFDLGHYTPAQARVFADAGKITEQEYQNIVGTD